MALVELDIADGVAVVTLNRPEAMNALSRALLGEFREAFARVAADESVKVAILTGAGERAFSAGLDLKEVGQIGLSSVAAGGAERRESLAEPIERCGKPVIGAVNGVAITGGFEVALGCDILIGSTNARFADTHVRVGVTPGSGLSQKLSRLIGVYRAKRLSLTGDFIDARTAQAWGILSDVVAPHELMGAARKIAVDIASCDPDMVRRYKSLIDDGFDLSFGDGMKLERERSAAENASLTPEAVEARRAGVLARGRKQKS